MIEIDLSGLKPGMENKLIIIVSNENSAEAAGYTGMPGLFLQILKKRNISLVCTKMPLRPFNSRIVILF